VDYQATTITITSAGDSGTGILCQAVSDAANGDTITFQDNPVTIPLSGTQIDIDKTLTQAQRTVARPLAPDPGESDSD